MQEKKPDAKLVYVTVGSRLEAAKIADAVVVEKLAACANLLPGVRSVFEWQGKVCREEEVVLILKTVAGRMEKLTDRIKELHSYECPCIVYFSIDGGNPDFLSWIADSLK